MVMLNFVKYCSASMYLIKIAKDWNPLKFNKLHYIRHIKYNWTDQHVTTKNNIGYGNIVHER